MAKDYSKTIGATVWTGIISCVVIVVIIILFLIWGITMLASAPYCDALYFGTEEPHVIVLPNLHKLSSSELSSLLAGSYELSSKYDLQLTVDVSRIFKLCIKKRYFTKVSACVEIGADLENNLICTPDMRPDCLPSAIIDHWFGVSLWFPDESTVTYYVIVNIESSGISVKRVTNTTTTLSDVWYDLLDCQVFTNLTIAVIFFGSLIFICCLGCAGWCLWICYKVKRLTPAVSYKQLRRQEQDDENAFTTNEVHEGSCCERSELLEEEKDEETFSLVPSELLQNEWSDAGQGGSSGEEEGIQVEVHPVGGASSRESVRTAVSERGYRRRDRRSRFVHSKPPLVGYFTDSSSVSGVATDMSTNDASDEESSDDEAGSHLNGQLSSSSSSVTPTVQEATGVGTPPPFAHFHPTTVYDQRPGVTTEPRRPPDGI